ncbi:MAG: AlpA family transcriptional regulator [Deltaproteobacteria bacterium]|nr:AlpA family transcriptional regulator [Deltaproteobacteria bacterium]
MTRVIRKPELLSRVPLSDPTIWRLEKAGRFPKRLQLGGNSVGWIEEEIEAWLAERMAARTIPQGVIEAR